MDIMEQALETDSGDRQIWQVNRGLLSPLYLPEAEELLSLPDGVRQWQVYELSLNPQQTVNLTVVFGRRAWLLALMGSYSQAAGYKALLYDAKRKLPFATTRELGLNLVGTARNPAWFPQPLELNPNSPLFLRVTNLATVAATGEIVLYYHLEDRP